MTRASSNLTVTMSLFETPQENGARNLSICRELFKLLVHYIRICLLFCFRHNVLGTGSEKGCTRYRPAARTAIICKCWRACQNPSDIALGRTSRTTLIYPPRLVLFYRGEYLQNVERVRRCREGSHNKEDHIRHYTPFPENAVVDWRNRAGMLSHSLQLEAFRRGHVRYRNWRGSGKNAQIEAKV